MHLGTLSAFHHSDLGVLDDNVGDDLIMTLKPTISYMQKLGHKSDSSLLAAVKSYGETQSTKLKKNFYCLTLVCP